MEPPKIEYAEKCACGLEPTFKYDSATCTMLATCSRTPKKYLKLEKRQVKFEDNRLKPCDFSWSLSLVECPEFKPLTETKKYKYVFDRASEEQNVKSRMEHLLYELYYRPAFRILSELHVILFTHYSKVYAEYFSSVTSKFNRKNKQLACDFIYWVLKNQTPKVYKLAEVKVPTLVKTTEYTPTFVDINSTFDIDSNSDTSIASDGSYESVTESESESDSEEEDNIKTVDTDSENEFSD